MFIVVFCSKHKDVKLEARLRCFGDIEGIEVDPCPECRACDEWDGYQDGLLDSGKLSGSDKGAHSV